MSRATRGAVVPGPAQGIGERLAAWLAAQLGADRVTIDEFRRHDEGFSWRTYTFRAQWTDPADGESRSQGFAIRLEPPDGLLAPYDTERQFRIHELVRTASPVPMADLFWLELDPDVLGAPFYVMERMEGDVPVQWRPRDPSVFPTDRVRHAMGLNFVDVSALIHQIDWRGAGSTLFDAPAGPEAAARDEVERWASFYEQARLVELPLVREAIIWLRRDPACSGRLALCHGDWRIGNFMVRGSEIVAVFDWELAHVSDPVQDLAYAGLPLWRGRDPRLSHLLEREEYLGRYEQQTGLRVTDEVFRFWTIHGLMKATASHVRACRAFQDGRVTDLRLAAMDHRVVYLLRHLQRALEAVPS